MEVKQIAVFAGTFDPITNGHIEILKRALKDFDKVILLLAINPDKECFFDTKTRLKMMKVATREFRKVKVDKFKGYTVNYAKKHHAVALIRGERNKKDREYELDLSRKNLKLAPKIRTVIYQADHTMQNISSTRIRALIKNGANIAPFVPTGVNKIIDRFIS